MADASSDHRFSRGRFGATHCESAGAYHGAWPRRTLAYGGGLSAVLSSSAASTNTAALWPSLGLRRARRSNACHCSFCGMLIDEVGD
jgi:hypothetical protein